MFDDKLVYVNTACVDSVFKLNMKCMRLGLI